MIKINKQCYELAREINIILKEETSKNPNLIKKANENGNKLLRNLNNIDFTTDNSVEGIYYALSSFLSLSLMSSKFLLIPKVITNATNKHLSSKTLPKYRKRLISVYSNKLSDVNNKIDELKNNMDDNNRGDIMEEIESLSLVKDQLERDLDRIKLVK